MKKLLGILVLGLLLSSNVHASETVYLKCPKIVTDNKSDNGSTFHPESVITDKWEGKTPYVVGNKVSTNFTKLKIYKSKTIITAYHYLLMYTAEKLRNKQSLGKPDSVVYFYGPEDPSSIKNIETKIDSEGKHEISLSMSTLGKIIGFSEEDLRGYDETFKASWFKKDNEWHFKEIWWQTFDGIESKLKFESKCSEISKKVFKNYLKNGEGLDFYN